MYSIVVCCCSSSWDLLGRSEESATRGLVVQKICERIVGGWRWNVTHSVAIGGLYPLRSGVDQCRQRRLAKLLSALGAMPQH